VLRRNRLALLNRLSYVGLLETLAVLLTPLALSVENAVTLFLGGEDLNDTSWLEPVCVLKATSQCALAV